MKKYNYFLLGACVFGFWGAANTFLGIYRYGLSQGVFWWFCNLALVGSAWALWTRNRRWLMYFLSVACFTQSLWVIDNLFRLFFERELLGLVDFMYRPGIPLDEFAMSHYHFFTIPVCAIALYFLPQKKSGVISVIAWATPFILVVSYFAFPSYQNINCIHSACFSGLQKWNGLAYTFTYFSIVMALNVSTGLALEWFFTNLKRRRSTSLFLKRGFAGLGMALVGITLWDIQYKSTLPNLTCHPATQTEFVKIGCDFTLDHSPGKLVFAYGVKNQTTEDLVCQTRAQTQYAEFVLEENVAIEAGERKQLKPILPYPDSSVKVTLTADCKPAGPRDLARESHTPSRRFLAR